MGANMAKNLAAAGHNLVLYDTNPKAYEGFEAHTVVLENPNSLERR